MPMLWSLEEQINAFNEGQNLLMEPIQAPLTPFVMGWRASEKRMRNLPTWNKIYVSLKESGSRSRL